MTLVATVRTRSFVFVFVFILFLRDTGRGNENPYLLKRLLDITVILLMERLVRKGGNGLKGVTQAGLRIPHDDLIKGLILFSMGSKWEHHYKKRIRSCNEASITKKKNQVVQ